MIEPDDFGNVMVSCLHDEGFPNVQLTSDGEGYEASTDSVASGKALAVAEYVCSTQYPVDPKYNQPLNDIQLKKLYQYFKGPLAQCLESHGYSFSTPPSEETFIDRYPSGGGWDPMNEVLESLQDPTRSGELNQACPHWPDGLYD